MKYELLNSLLPFLEEYERTYPKHQHPQHFAVWLARQTSTEEQVANKETDSGPEVTEATEIQRIVLFLNRYMKSYAKKALEVSSLGNLDEYLYLHAVSQAGGLSKSDLIYRNRHEKPTGMEIIRRLLAGGLIAQTDDQEDRRSKQLHITEYGQAALNQVVARMDFVTQLLSGSLNGAEKLLLLQILEKMESFHQLLQAKTKGGDFEEIVRATRG
ncbi:MAG TPA: MarR family transcriptional regulator [Saprospiraceae bacterium]|nr:MarR family transcriptional regulator [Saprospiraceae bacterium]HPI09091.1 MarR family transcriptional regulator [Saprospiraceae bacterium]